MGKFGFNALNKSQNNNSNQQSTNLGLTKDNLENLILVGRVIDIILDDKHSNFKSLGEWTSLGTIEFINVNVQSTNITPNSSKLFAKPLFSNIKNYPIFNEIVYIISLPNKGVMENGADKQYYYFSPINVWNNPHHNAVPFFKSLTSNNSQNKSYQTTSTGNVNKTKETSLSIDLGPGFKEYSNIHPLSTYLGDYILEGRWGNSIRIGSTVKNSSNNWSTSGENGNPITIIRNGQPTNSSTEGWLPITENINDDLSSMYLTSNQIIPIKLSSDSYKSYSTSPIKPDKFTDSQIIISSGRVVLNSIKDHILLSSPTSINLNSKDSINVDSKNLFVVDSKTIKLGNKDTNNPMLKGDETIKAMNIICDQLIKISQALSTLAEIFPTAPQVAVNIAASEASVQINMLKGNLNNLKSKTNFLI